MSTTPTVTEQPTSTPAPSKFTSIMQHILKFVTLGLVDLTKYSAPVALLAAVLFPEYASMDAAAQAKVTQIVQLIQNAVLTIQQKYASASASDTTNAAKLADVLAIVETTAVTELQQIGIGNSSVDRVTAVINAIVAILKAQPGPAGS